MSVESVSPVDPRIQIELEKLNTATDNINKYEVELDEAKSEFKQLLVESVEKIKLSAHKLSNSIQTAKPYYEARLYSAQLAKECHLAAVNHEKAKSIHAAAKEMVYLAEQGLGEKSTLDTACQEMLSHAASRVNESQLECTDTKNVMKICDLKQEVANNRVAKLQSQLKSAIKASRPYYETRANYNGVLKGQKKRIHELEGRVRDAKLTYNEALKNLEQISEEIHRMRDEERFSSETDEQIADALQQPQSTSSNNVYMLKSPSSRIHSSDEYLDFPPQLTTKSSPIRQQRLDHSDCPHLLRDFDYNYTQLQGSSSASSKNITSPDVTAATTSSDDMIEQWTEIRLSNSDSTSSGYSQHSMCGGNVGDGLIDDRTPPTESSTSSGGGGGGGTTGLIKTITITCNGAGANESTAATEGLSSWITKSNAAAKNGSRRQSLDILIDAGDRVKDAFATGIFKVGKSLERRNSESEMAPDAAGGGGGSTTSDFFSFSRSDNKDSGLSDEQVENLLLNDEEDCTDMLQNVLNISK